MKKLESIIYTPATNFINPAYKNALRRNNKGTTNEILEDVINYAPKFITYKTVKGIVSLTLIGAITFGTVSLIKGNGSSLGNVYVAGSYDSGVNYYGKESVIDIAPAPKISVSSAADMDESPKIFYTGRISRNDEGYVHPEYKSKKPVVEDFKNMEDKLKEIPSFLYSLDNIVNDEYLLVVDKEKERMGLYHYLNKEWDILNNYDVKLGINKGAKARLYDKKTPEGDYIGTWTLGETVGWGYRLNYPNKIDKALGKTGSEIFIHEKKSWRTGTNGCIGVRQGVLEQIREYAEDKVRIIIKPEIGYFNNKYFNQLSSKPRISRIKRIVLHHTAGTSAQSAFTTFKNNMGRKSAHYIIDKDGTLYPLVPEDRIAYHTHNYNNNTIGVEIVNLGNGKDPYKSIQYETLNHLLDSIFFRYNLSKNDDTVVGHKELDNRVDPSSNFDWTLIGLSDSLHESRKIYKEDRFVSK